MLKRTSILKLQTEESLLEGHDACAAYLERSVEDLLLHPADLDHAAQQALLDELVPVFTEDDNRKLLTKPDSEKVFEVLSASNLHAAPGTDGLPSFLYKHCWDVFKEPLTEVMGDIFDLQTPTCSQRTSLMVFGCKPKKPNSILPRDKRKISLLNSDFKISSGIEANLLKSTATHTLSPLQLVAVMIGRSIME